jgi:hypothetical protein
VLKCEEPERLQATIPLNHGNIKISWAARRELLTRLQEVRSANGIRFAFVTVGASSTVELTRKQRVALLNTLVRWKLASGADMPADLHELCDALTQEMATPD